MDILNTAILIGNIFLVFGTFIMAYYTKKSMDVMNLTRKESNKAQIIAYFKIMDNEEVQIIIENTGKTIAKNVSIISEPPIKNLANKEIDILKGYEIPSFPPNFKIENIFALTNNIIYENKNSKFNITISYINIYQKEETESYILDLSYIKDLVIKTNETNLKKELLNINHSLKDINNTLKNK